jgi:hypothetical protein
MLRQWGVILHLSTHSNALIQCVGECASHNVVMHVGMGYKKEFPDPGNSQAEAKRNKRNCNEPWTRSVVKQFSEEQTIKNVKIAPRKQLNQSTKQTAKHSLIANRSYSLSTNTQCAWVWATRRDFLIQATVKLKPNGTRGMPTSPGQ